MTSESKNDELLAELRQVQQVQTRFLADLVHQIRNCLTPAVNSVELLRRYGQDQKIRDEAAAIIDRQLSLLTNLLDGISEATRKIRPSENQQGGGRP